MIFSGTDDLAVLALAVLLVVAELAERCLKSCSSLAVRCGPDVSP